MDLKLCLDTNVFIAVTDNEPNAPECKKILNSIEVKSVEANLSTIVIAEMLVGFYSNGDHIGADKFLSKVNSLYQIFPVSLEIAKKGAEIRSTHNIRLPDALIYATMLNSKADFLISNDHPLKKKDPKILTPTEFVQKFHISDVMKEKK